MATVIEKKLLNHPSLYINDEELSATLQLGIFQRHGLVKRALQKGDLIRVRRGLYCIGENLTKTKPNPYVLAQKIYWPSYISMETALSYHGLIPEAVYTTTSVTTKRNKVFHTPYGTFNYAKLPADNFFLQVLRKSENNVSYFVATPWKAICDYVYCHKKNWRNLQPLNKSLRIETDELPPITTLELTELKNYYQSKRMTDFILGIKKELQL